MEDCNEKTREVQSYKTRLKKEVLLIKKRKYDRIGTKDYLSKTMAESNSHPKYKCQELSEELVFLQDKRSNLVADFELAKKIKTPDDTLNWKRIFEQTELLVSKVKVLKKKLYTPEELKMIEVFKESYNFQLQNYIDKKILNQDGKYTCNISGKYYGQEFTVPNWDTVENRLTKRKLKEIKTLGQGLFTFYPLGLKMKEVAKKGLAGKAKWESSDPILEEKLYYFPESLNQVQANTPPKGAKTLSELMDETNGFLVSVIDKTSNMLPAYPGTAQEKMAQYLTDCRKNTKSLEEGKFPLSFQQYLAGQIASFAKDGKPFDAQRTDREANSVACTLGSVFPNAILLPEVDWLAVDDYFVFMLTVSEPPAWRGREGVIL